MKLSTFLTSTAIIYIPFGLGMILVPQQLFGMYGFDLNADGIVLGQIIGAAIIGMGLTNYLSRNDSLASPALRAILTGNLVYHAFDTVLDFLPTYHGTLNALTYSMVGLHIVLAVGFAYFLRKRPA